MSGTQFTPEILQRLLSSYGASNSAGNANKIREFAASNPDVLERRAMGMRGSGVDDNSDILGLQLEKFMQAADGRAMNAPEQAEAPIPNGTVTAGAPQMVAKAAPIPQGSRGSPNMEPQMQPGFNDMSETTSPGIGKSGGNFAQRADAAIAPDNLMPWILAALGLGSMSGRGDMNPAPRLPAPTPASPRAIDNSGALIEGANPSQKRIGYEPKVEDANSGRKMTESGAPQLDPNGVDVERKKMLQAEIDAENAGALQKQIQEQSTRNKQNSTRDLLTKAGKAVGRK